jgi:C4-dicarboxylate-specific signal transduction histidine kinase
MRGVTALGELSASLAHEINQPLAAIVTNAQAALPAQSAGRRVWRRVKP